MESVKKIPVRHLPQLTHEKKSANNKFEKKAAIGLALACDCFILLRAYGSDANSGLRLKKTCLF